MRQAVLEDMSKRRMYWRRMAILMRAVEEQ
jgi:hypothetical protein